VPRTITEAKAVTRKHVEPLFSILRPLRQPGRVVAVPDTNVLIRSPDLARWSTVIGSTSFMVLLVPAVLAELDALKMNHRIEAVREKARSFSNRIRGWRHQGNLGEGVRVEGDVWLKVVAREPDFKATLSWLDSDVADDRIIASILAYQWSRPSDAVVLLSGDSVMLAKADEAEVPTADTPEPDP
jgi:predicted ribonuclease YlaK